MAALFLRLRSAPEENPLCPFWLGTCSERWRRVLFVCVLQSSSSCGNIIFKQYCRRLKGSNVCWNVFQTDWKTACYLLAITAFFMFRGCFFVCLFVFIFDNCFLNYYFCSLYFWGSNSHCFQGCLQAAFAMLEIADLHRCTCRCRGICSVSKVWLICYFQCYITSCQINICPQSPD